MSVNEVKIKRAPFELEVRGTGHPGSRTFAIGDEDHTLGNSLRHVLMQNAKIGFAGYSVPHPSEPVVHLRVQTCTSRKRNGKDGYGGVNDDDKDDDRMSAIDALKEACETLISQCDIVLDQVEESMPEVRQDRLCMEEIIQSEGYDAEENYEEEGEGDYADDQGMDAMGDVY
mmetsp:Transcript_10667/g.15049  ORF Transcript_10667/g.15049 Transcript_10667/m.15049 type:complete len:172 (+) Transcript_10667:55-570(+)|eukprot:CAMPEP_0184861456 /NCGR_PEP_ID=MMETSP0580-20130426/6145_1 /TAXON_ID=1118495 /ORGANISM="Dactyliosolen fragilissimus" /LENGTH=171 /DNA_ID=CAMNT_0027358967 /DNA_START=8 /DNA_END=523 /DNA_ORIENTATION=+